MNSTVDIFSDCVSSSKTEVIQDGHRFFFDKGFEIKHFIHVVPFNFFHPVPELAGTLINGFDFRILFKYGAGSPPLFCCPVIGIFERQTLTIAQINKLADSPDKSEKHQIDKIEIPAQITGKIEQIITHIGYNVSYNSDWKIPNWVAYELTKEEAEGVVPRHDAFMPDPEVPYTKSATTNDYKNSGWNRGHMAPAGDMKWSEQAMKESFYLSNICPQNKNLNSGIWKDLEEQVRGLTTQKGKNLCSMRSKQSALIK